MFARIVGPAVRQAGLPCPVREKLVAFSSGMVFSISCIYASGFIADTMFIADKTLNADKGPCLLRTTGSQWPMQPYIHSKVNMNTQQGARIRLIGSIGEKLVGRGCFLGTAESCTGGLVAKYCTDMAGSSAWFKGGVVSYANAVKENLLGVEKSLLEKHGAVSEPVVQHMALGALERLGVEMALATSGVAGPDGGTKEKPVGTVWMAVAFRAGGAPAVRSFVARFDGNREAVREQAAEAVLQAALNMLEQE